MFSFPLHGSFKGNQASYKNTKIPLALPYKSTILFLIGQYILYLEISPTKLACLSDYDVEINVKLGEKSPVKANFKALVTFRISINFIQMFEINMHYESKIFFKLLQWML